MLMPNRNASKQDYATPWELIHAVEARFGKIEVDLAAHKDNHRAALWIGKETDSLSVQWPGDRIMWLNPEFAKIEPWAKRCSEWLDAVRTTGLILFLTPASVGARWWREYVHERAHVYFLSPRIVFEGMTQPFPKDCSLALYGHPQPGYEIWRWK